MAKVRAAAPWARRERLEREARVEVEGAAARDIMMAVGVNGVERIKQFSGEKRRGSSRQFLRLLNDPPLRER